VWGLIGDDAVLVLGGVGCDGVGLLGVAVVGRWGCGPAGYCGGASAPLGCAARASYSAVARIEDVGAACES